MAQPVKGVTYPKKLFPSVQAAIHDVGGVRATDYENAGQIDATNDNVAALGSRVAVVEAKAALVPYLQCGDGSPFKGTGNPQLIRMVWARSPRFQSSHRCPALMMPTSTSCPGTPPTSK